jgi:hypothetical protein
MANTPNPELDKILASLQAEIQQSIQKFSQQMQGEVEKAGVGIAAAVQKQAAAAAPGNVPSFKSLPWFQHGVRGFVRKLWYGDHPENPTWQNVRRESVVPHLTLAEYAAIKAEVQVIAEEAGAFGAAIDQLTADITHSISTHFQKAYDLGYTRTNTAASTAAPASTPETPEPAAPTSEPAAVEPEAPATPVAPTSKPVKSRRLKTKPASVETPPEAPPEPNNPLATTAKELSSILKTTDDKAEMALLLQKAGVKMKGNKVLGSRTSNQSFETLVRLVHQMGQEPESGVSPDDWLTGDLEALFGIKIPTQQLDKTRVALYRELEKEFAATESVLFNTIRGRRILSEVRTLPIKNRINFFVNAMKR